MCTPHASNLISVTPLGLSASAPSADNADMSDPDMSSLDNLTSADAVRQAIAEFDALGREPFLDRYGYGPAKRYFVELDGKRYDSKAIYGVAVGYQHPDRGPLRNAEFSGGERTVKRVLENLGFTVEDG